MKTFIIVAVLFLSSFAFAQIKIHQMGAEDQKFYKNESGTGMNQLERVDSTVKEINNLHGKIANLQAEVDQLKKDVTELKNKKKE